MKAGAGYCDSEQVGIKASTGLFMMIIMVNTLGLLKEKKSNGLLKGGVR